MIYEWDERKREANLAKHALDFVDASRVYEHPLKMTLASPHRGERRLQTIAPADTGRGTVLVSLIYTLRGDAVRVISLRSASRHERRLYEAHKNDVA